ncbi:MAG: dihydrolipoyl dehydrogenase [Spirochaetales bacterium]|nr:dihydrolipoyl dehydrogenase [Spirochaetales bacterium]
MSKNYDVVIIGSGPGGYVAAIRASQLGLKTGIAEKEKAGGICLNLGCIPSKSLIHHATLFRSIKELSRMGVKSDITKADYSYIQKESRIAAEKLSKGVHFLFKKNNIDFYRARASILSKNKVQLSTGESLNAKNIIIATGSRPRGIPGFTIDEKDILSSIGALSLTELPGTMLIIGGGAIGIEFAYIFNAFGVKVHVVEVLDRILPREDMEVADTLTRILKRQGIKINTSIKPLSCIKKEDSFSVILENDSGEKQEIVTDKILIAAGRIPNSEQLYPEQFVIKQTKGFIDVGDYYQTAESGIFAIGDVIDTPQFAHVASKEGEIAACYIAGNNPPARIDPDLIPGAVYCEPQVGSFGPTEQELKKENIQYKKVIFPYKGAGKAVAIRQVDGFVKLLYEDKQIIGAHILGSEASELIHQILIVKKAGLLPEDCASMIHAHPTLSETVMEAMRGIDGWMIHT